MLGWTEAECYGFGQGCFPLLDCLSDRPSSASRGWRSGQDRDFLLGMKNLMEHVEYN